ncbi:quinolinate synthase A [Striga asiatica]|uniref:Quinolinate synthase A n=1 Tax=Striga asiatica TaxID=4170 RepID=A0A5A7QXG7_STRAF|nr:quinolinate synthase A [Striga asiatica]
MRIRTFPIRASGLSLSDSANMHQLSNTPTVRTVHGSYTCHVYCSFHLGSKLSITVRASVDPFPGPLDFIGSKPRAPRIPSSKIPTGGFQSCLAVGRKSLQRWAASSSTW